MKNGCPNQASKQLKPNGQMERMVKITKKDQARHPEVTPIIPISKKNEATQEAKGNAKRGKIN